MPIYKKSLLSFLFFMGILFSVQAQVAQPFNPRLPGGNIKVKGDMTILSNNILNTRILGPRQLTPATHPSNAPWDPNVAYNDDKANNNNLPLAYIDIDSDPNTFSSSSATLTSPDCSQIIYAGLYWGGTYPFNEGNSTANAESGDPIRTTDVPAANDYNRDLPYESVKFKVPGGSYVDIGPSSPAIFNYQRIYDKDGDTNRDGISDITDIDLTHSPYLNYADVTSLVTPLGTSPDGEYTIANVVGTIERKQGGSLAGWTLVVIYENPNLSSKYISTFDGFAGISGSNRTAVFSYNGFRTLPGTLPVKAKIGIAAMEGDRVTPTGSKIEFKANSSAGFTALSDPINPENNFFNSTISKNGVYDSARNPNSENTLGWDMDFFNLDNPFNGVLPNDETGADVRISLPGGNDVTYLYLNTISVEIIEPEIILEKQVRDIAGNDITGSGVSLGQTLDYVLAFQNIGNDDAQKYSIRDVLPVNTTFIDADVSGAPGTTYTYDNATRTVVFNVPDNLIEEKDPRYTIRIQVKVEENCFDFVTACSNRITNIAFSNYQGILNTQVISDDPSISSLSGCGLPVPGTTNFLLDDLGSCTFTRTVQLCGDDVLLDAGDSFDTYIWVSDDNNNGAIDPTDTVLKNGTDDTLLVDEEGTYIVDKIVADPCKGFVEVFEVERFGSATVNPIISYFNTVNSDADVTNDIDGEIVTCSVDGDQLANIFLCGTTDTQILQSNITDAKTISWQQLDEGSCTVAPTDCANKNGTCTWNEVATGSTHTVNSAGKFRLVVTYTNGCFNRFYFDVYQNVLDIKYDTADIICTTDGFINITNLGAGYGFQLIDITTNNILVPFSANNGPNFPITTNGQYRIDIVQLDTSGNPIPNACVFSTNNIGVRDRDFKVDVTTTPANCNDQGNIKIDVLNVERDYTYTLRRPDGTLIDDETAQPDNTHTFNVNEGNYIIEVSTDDGCAFSQDVNVLRTPDPTASAVTTQNIGCTAGTITLTPNGGFLPHEYLYAVWRKDGTGPADVTDIPAGSFQSIPVFSFGWRDTDSDGFDEYFAGENGDYIFIIVDPNNCFSFSNEVTITDNGAMTVTVTEDNLVTCSGTDDAQITLVTAGGTSPFTYSIDGAVTTQTTPTFVGLSAGKYLISVTDSSGCTIDFEHEIVEPFPLSASAGVSRDATCDPMGAEVRITNVVGGTAPYEYSFDGGGTFGAPTIAVLPVGTYTIIVRDATSCEFPMAVTVEDTPPPPGVSTPDVSYACDGTATVTAAPNNPAYNYTFELDGVLNSPDPASNIFLNVPPGTYTVKTNYTRATAPTPSLLLSEDFGNGLTISNPNTSGYFYENQLDDTSPSGAPVDNDKAIDDYEYAVTNNIEKLFSSWINPKDHTSNGTVADGRYLVINIGAPTPGQIIYQKTVNDIIPNRPIDVSLWLTNLLRSTSTFISPDLTIELRDTGSGVIVASANTGAIPNNEAWNEYILSLNPGVNTSLDLVITTNESRTNGNDIAIDDITVYQAPEVCPLSVETPITVLAGKVFEANKISSTNVSCNGLTDGTITFEAENFDTATGFEYSTDGGTNWTNSTTSPVTTAAIYGAGSHTILIRKASDITCATSITTMITESTAVIADASITTTFTCDNTGATITASASGGTPTYEYQLEDTAGGVVTAYQTSVTFTNIVAGDYIVRVRDINGCTDPIDTAITVTAPVKPIFTVVPTACYSGANDATIVVDVTSLPGNGGFQFSLNSGPFVTPTPATATTYTFNTLANGTYTIDVRDAFGCKGVQQTLTINPKLTAIVAATDISCTDGSITVTASGGDGNYEYAYVNAGTAVTAADFSTSATFAVTAGNDGDYDVYVRDNNAGTPHCEYLETVTVNAASTLVFTATGKDPQCHNGVGSIDVAIASGDTPYEIRIVDLNNAGASNQTVTNILKTTQSFFNLLTGDYEVYVKDVNGCETQLLPNITINNPDELTATINPILPSTCGSVNPLDYGFRFVGYPTTYPTGTTIEFSADGGTTWTGDDSVPGTTDTLMGYISGTSVFPSMRTVVGGVEICRTDLPRYIIPFPLDDLDISVSTVVVACNELQVTVQGTAGVPNYEYTFTDDPSTFNIATATWTAAIPGAHTWTGLIPGRTYVFYVRDNTGCVRQSNVNVNDITTNPLDIDADFEPSCSAANDAEVTYTITDTDATVHPSMRWEFYNVNTGALLQTNPGYPAAVPSATTITINGLAPGEYYIVVTEVDATNVDACVSGSENLLIEELDPITATLNKLSDISCNSPGLISVENIKGGGGIFTYSITGPAGFTKIASTSDNPMSIPANSPAGDYDILITDQFGCFSNLGTVNLTLSPNPTIDSMVVDNCAAPTSLTISASSTAPKILYSIDGGTNYVDNSGVFNNLATGVYNIAIIDSNGCTDADTVEIFPVLEVNASLTKLIDCTATPDAEITIDVTVGSGNYDYEITNAIGTVVARTALPTDPFVFATAIPENYTITIYDNSTSAPTCNRVFNVNVPPVVSPAFTETHIDVSCNGASDGIITLSETLNGLNPLTFAIAPLAGTFNAAANAFEDLPMGTYTVTGTGSNNCTFDIAGIVIGEPAPIIVPPVTVVEFSCAVGNNPNNATITINPGTTGGSSNYVVYEFVNNQGTVATGDDVIVQSGSSLSYTETDIAGGSYAINVYDDQGCIGSTTATILPFFEISNPTVTTTQDITCDPAILEEIQVSVTINPATATPTLEYTTTGINVTYNQSNATGIFTGLQIGNYAISITNLDTGCVVETTHEVLDPDVIEVLANKLTDEECLNNGVNEGSFEITINNYTGNYSYQLFDNTDTAVAGPGFSGNSDTTVPLIISNLPGGVYYVRIIEIGASFCQDDSNTITIIAPEFPVSATVSEQASPSCTDDQGSILVDPEGGVGPYKIVLMNTTTSQSYTETNVSGAFIFNDLSGGDFNVTITDTQACSFTNTITMLTPTPLVASIASTPLVCFNGSNATITGSVNVRNVTPNYLYQLNRYDETGTKILNTSANQTSSTFTDLSAGFYSVTVNDDVSCSDESDVIEIVNPSEVVAELIRTSALTCTTSIELELSARGGSGTYEYSFDNTTWYTMTGSSLAISNANAAAPLGAGTYRYFIRDTSGCGYVTSNEISEDPITPLTFTEITATTIGCVGDKATITADAIDGLGNYMYELFTDASLSSASRIHGPQSSGTFTGLDAGTYYVNVTSEDCTAPAEKVVIVEPIPLDYTENIVNALCFGDENGSITVTLSGGAGGYQYAISPNLSQFSEENTFENLAPGDYTVIAQDQNGCFIQLDYTITAPDSLAATGVATPEVCEGDGNGTITLTIQGGTAPYSTRLSSETNFVENRTVLTDLSSGGYIIFVKDANGCIIDVSKMVDPGANLNATVEPVYECNGATPDNYINITFEDSDIIDDVLYALDSTDPADLQLSPDFKNISSGMHFITIAHANGCVRTVDFEIDAFETLTLSLEQSGINAITATAAGGAENYTYYFGDKNNGADNSFFVNRTDTYEVKVVDSSGCEAIAEIFIEFIDIEIPNFFTPNGDNNNDVWLPRNQEGFPKILTVIFDRYGREVYSMTIDTPGWNGIYEETELPTGDYWYVMKLGGENDDREFVGHFTLYR